MCNLDTVGSFWLTDFCYKGEKDSLLSEIENSFNDKFDWNYLINRLRYDELKPFDDAYKKACKVSAIRYCIESGFVDDALTEEEAKKCKDNFYQNQYNLGLFTKLLSKIYCFLDTISRHGLYKNDGDRQDAYRILKNLLKVDVRAYTDKFRREEIEKSFTELKKQIEKIASGVKGECYFAGEDSKYRKGEERLAPHPRFEMYDWSFNFFRIDDELNESVEKKYAYDFNAVIKKYGCSRAEFAVLNRLFCKSLLNDDAFWTKHEKFDVFYFIESVKNKNGKTHAEKILFYIFDEIKKLKYADAFLKNSISLGMFDRSLIEEAVECLAKNRLFYRNKEACAAIEKDNLCYPLSYVEDAEVKIAKGKELTLEFFKAIYPYDWEKVIQFINDSLSTGVQLEDVGLKMADVMDLLYGPELLRKCLDAVQVFCPQYHSDENVWNRFYIKIYTAKKIFGEGFVACTFEEFYYLIDIFNRQLGLKTAYQQNTQGRENAFKKLKEILARYCINPSERFKENYIISLLDGRVALLNERMQFSVLEQLGDAIYGFAVAETMFYNSYRVPYIEERNMAEKFESYIRAEAQIAITHKIGLTKLFISPTTLQGSQESITPSANHTVEKDKYLADMLEMVIGSVCIEFGYDKAIDFVKKIVRETYPNEFGKEVRWFDDEDEEIRQKYNIRPYYWAVMRPAVYSEMEECHEVLWRALHKLVVAITVGTKEKAAREFITYTLPSGNAYNDKYGTTGVVLKPFYDYLQNGKKGLEHVLENYSNHIEEYYKKEKAY